MENPANLSARPSRPVASSCGAPGRADQRNLRSLNRITLIGSTVAAVFVLGSLAWAAISPLASAAIASGMVSPEGNRRVVQHLEGGIVRRFHVRDGDVVRSGDVLLELDATRDKATLDLLRVQHLAGSAAMARLAAEDAGVEEIDFPADILSQAKGNAAAQAIVTAERQRFSARRAANSGQKSVLKQRIAQSREEIVGFEAKIASAVRQLELLEEEIIGVAALLKQGLERKPRLLLLERAKAQIGGEMAASRSGLARAGQVIGESEMEMLALDNAFRDKVATERAEIRRELAGLEERLRSSDDIVSRTRIVAPVDGTVVGSRYHTVGGVVAAGSPILEIVPSNEKLTIDVQVQPNDIDVVREGQPALVRFSAYHQRNLPRVNGRVIYVAADSTQDQKTGRAYFLARVSVDAQHLKEIAPAINLSAGMPADVAITTGTRTALQYAFDPLMQSFERSFVED